MNKRHFEAFAEEARKWRKVAKENEANGDKTAAGNAYSMALGIEYAVIKVGKRFNAQFDEAKFRAACNVPPTLEEIRNARPNRPALPGPANDFNH